MFFQDKQDEIERLKRDTKTFEDLAAILRELIEERKAETARYERLIKEAQEEIDLLRPKFTTGFQVLKSRTEVKCVFENMTPEERSKPIGIVCFCPRCTPYSM